MLPEKLIVPLIDNVKNHTHKIVVVLVTVQYESFSRQYYVPLSEM